jgi:hypothetical protein
VNALKVLINFISTYSDFSGVEAHYSQYTSKYYCSVPFEIKDGCVLKGVCCHADTIEESAEDIINQINGKLLVFNASTSDRKEVFFYKDET